MSILKYTIIFISTFLYVCSMESDKSFESSPPSDNDNDLVIYCTNDKLFIWGDVQELTLERKNDLPQTIKFSINGDSVDLWIKQLMDPSLFQFFICNNGKKEKALNAIKYQADENDNSVTFYASDKVNDPLLAGSLVEKIDEIEKLLLFLSLKEYVDGKSIDILKTKVPSLSLERVRFKTVYTQKIVELFNNLDQINISFFSQLSDEINQVMYNNQLNCEYLKSLVTLCENFKKLTEKEKIHHLNEIVFLKDIPVKLRQTKLFVSLISDVLLRSSYENRPVFMEKIANILNSQFSPVDKSIQLEILIHSHINPYALFDFTENGLIKILHWLYEEPLSEENLKVWAKDTDYTLKDYDALGEHSIFQNPEEPGVLPSYWRMYFLMKNVHFKEKNFHLLKMQTFLKYCENWQLLSERGYLPRLLDF